MTSFSLGSIRHTRYSREQQLELCRRAQAGDINARNELVVAYTPLVLKLTARNPRVPQDEWDDCHSYCFMRLMRAVEKFELDRGLAVSTYFWTTIANSIRRFIRYRGTARYVRPHISLDVRNEAEHPASDDTTWQTVAAADHKRITEAQAEYALRFITERERAICARYYAGATLKEVGEETGVTRERVRQIKLVALARMRRALEANPMPSDLQGESRAHDDQVA